MTNIHLVGGEKGGVGKSLVSRLLAQYFIDHSVPFLGFDSDRSHGALMRFTQESSMTKIDAGSNSFWTATQPEDQGGMKLGILERQRVRSWLKSAYEALSHVNP